MNLQDLLNDPKVKAVRNAAYYAPNSYLELPDCDANGVRGETAHLFHKDLKGRWCCDPFELSAQVGGYKDNDWEPYHLPPWYIRPKYPLQHDHELGRRQRHLKR